MIKYFALIPVVLFATVNLFAQGTRVPGYIILSNGDTSRGFIVDRKDSWHVDAIEFSSSETAAPEKYSLKSIKGFYLETFKVFYRSATTEIDRKPVDIDHLERHATQDLVVESLLLERLVAGPLSFYKYEGKRGKQHFFVEKNGVLSELGFVRYQSPKGVVNSNLFVHTLKALTSDCDNAGSPPGDFAEAALAKFVKKYNECITGIKAERTRSSNRLSGTIFGGAGISFVKLVTPNENEYQSGSYGSSPNIMGGLRLDLVSKRETNRHRIGIQVFYSQYAKVYHDNTTGLVTRHYSLGLSTIQGGFVYRYTFGSAKRISPYVQLELNMVDTRDSKITFDYIDEIGIGHKGTVSNVYKLGIGGAPAFGVNFNKWLAADVRMRFMALPTETGVNQVVVTGPEITLGYTVF